MKIPLLFVIVVLTPTLAYSQKYHGPFAWSPDDKTILFATETIINGKSSFVLSQMNTDGSNVKKLTDGAWAPAWSPDRKKIAYTLHTPKGNEIIIADPDGKNAKQLTSNEVADMEPSFSHDSKKLSFTSNRDGKYQIYTMNIDGSSQEKLFSIEESCFSSSWSPQSTFILFYKDKGDHMDKVCIYDMKMKEVKNITQDSLHNFYPSWTRDGSILFTSTSKSDSKNKNTRLFLQSPAKKGKLQIGELPGWYSRLSSDGKKIAYTKIEQSGSEIFVANSDGTANTCITCK